MMQSGPPANIATIASNWPKPSSASPIKEAKRPPSVGASAGGGSDVLSFSLLRRTSETFFVASLYATQWKRGCPGSEPLSCPSPCVAAIPARYNRGRLWDLVHGGAHPRTADAIANAFQRGPKYSRSSCYQHRDGPSDTPSRHSAGPPSLPSRAETLPRGSGLELGRMEPC